AIERNISLSGHFLRLGFFPAFLRRLLGRSNLAPTNSRLALPDIPPSPLDEIPHLRVRKVCLAPQETIEQRLDPLHESLDRASQRSALRLGDCDSVLLKDSVVVARPHRRSELGNGFFRCELLANGLALAKHGAPFCNRCRELVNHRILAGDSTSCYKRITRLRPPCASCDQTSKPSVSRNLMRGRPSHLGGRRVSWRNDIDGIRFRIVSASKSMALTQLEPSTRIGIQSSEILDINDLRRVLCATEQSIDNGRESPLLSILPPGPARVLEHLALKAFLLLDPRLYLPLEVLHRLAEHLDGSAVFGRKLIERTLFDLDAFELRNIGRRGIESADVADSTLNLLGPKRDVSRAGVAALEILNVPNDYAIVPLAPCSTDHALDA